MRITGIVLLLVFAAYTAQAQKKYTISGYIKDAQTTEALINAVVQSKTHNAVSTTNEYGFYSLTITEGSTDIVYSYVGYADSVIAISLQKDISINVNLSVVSELQEATVSAQSSRRSQNSTQMSTINIPIQQIKILPTFLGEVDILKSLQLMPGVQSGGEGSSGLYVRGGGPDQNLILLDGVPVYNASHLFGFFSVFNADAINNVELYKGGFPARYGGRASSVIDINMKEGNSQEFHGEGSIGFVSAKLTLEGPIVKDKTSFMVSGRRTYIDFLMKPFMGNLSGDEDTDLSLGYYFYDLSAKVNHQFSNKDRLFLSAYFGSDKFYMKEEESYSYDYANHSSTNKSRLQWGNLTSALRWNHVFSGKLFSNTTVTYSRFKFLTATDSEEKNYTSETRYYNMKYSSGIQDVSAKISFDYMPSPNHHIRFGGSGIYHDFNPGAMGLKSEEVRDTTIGANKIYTSEYSAYIEDDITITQKLKANIGLRWSAFSVRDQFYHHIQPRISARYLFTDEFAVKGSYANMVQYVHLLTNSGVSLPTDLWVPTTDVLKPQKSDQTALGFIYNQNNTYEFGIEGYYKTMDNILEYKEGTTTFDLEQNWENNVLQGGGKSYGVEFLVQKTRGKLTGWLGYTLSWTDRQFDYLNNGKRFYYKYDRRHDISLVVTYRPTSKIELSCTWVFGTGNAITIPVATHSGINPINPSESTPNINEYSDRNAYRMPSYHRMDIGVNFIKKKRWGERRWVISIYNVYNRKNPYFIDIDTDYSVSYDPSSSVTPITPTQKTKFVQYSIFPIIPSISYQFKF